MPRAGPPAKSSAGARALDTYDLANASCRLLKLALRRAGELVAEEIGEAGLRPRPFMTLIAIHQNPGITQNDLVKISGSDRSTVGELIQRFATRGFIKRTRDAQDQRMNRLYVTETGSTALRESLPGTLRAEERFHAMVPTEHRTIFFEILAMLAEDGEASEGDPEDQAATVG
jgi:MarR family transcriptional regulator, temperature-dependent positive regulator of motility